MTRYQILAVAIAMLVHMTDGFDLLAISFAGPAIDREWMLGPERLGELFSAGLLGMAVGAFGLIRTSSFFIGFASFAAAVGMFSIMVSGFPPHVRATGIGLSFTAGRFGSAVGAYLGGILLALGLERPELCVILALPAIGAAIVISFLGKRNIAR